MRKRINNKIDLLNTPEELRKGDWKRDHKNELEELGNKDDSENQLIHVARKALEQLPSYLFNYQNHYVSLNYMVAVLQESLDIVEPTKYLLKVE